MPVWKYSSHFHLMLRFLPSPREPRLLTHLGSEFVVPLHKFIIVSGPMGNSVVHLEHACVAGLEDRHEALHHRTTESFAVHPFPEVKLLRGDLATHMVPEVAVIEDVLFEDELAEFYLFASYNTVQLSVGGVISNPNP